MVGPMCRVIVFTAVARLCQKSFLFTVMGLSGRKEKQRIGNDPRNLTWADDAAKFGSSYLSKFGWDSSKGLGAEGEGRVSHIKVSQKLDMLGIGAAQQRDPNGIAWKQNKDFERLLERLNADTEPEVKTEATEGDEEEKKRKREDGDEAVVKKKRRKSEPVTEAEVVVAVEAAKPLVPRHRAHRARAIAAKNIASKSAAAIAEILGVAPTPSTTATATPEGTLTPYDDDIPLEKLSTSTKASPTISRTSSLPRLENPRLRPRRHPKPSRPRSPTTMRREAVLVRLALNWNRRTSRSIHRREWESAHRSCL
ncbi:hypothetical protein B0H14DRAFT_656772 [Mycena olivaceomarginata]|nr:hypothetical protein B0H14DRAFT_656772 [Mycena olivaceomarginata]